MASYRGRDVVVLLNDVDISGDGRSISYEESADILDDTVYQDDNHTKLASLLDGSGSFEGLDSTGTWSAVWAQIKPGTTDILKIHPEGTLSGKREVSFNCIIKTRSLDIPYDDLAKVSLAFEISGPVTEIAQA